MQAPDKLCPCVLRSTLVDILAEAIETVADCAISTDPALERRRTAAATSRAMLQQEFEAKEYCLYQCEVPGHLARNRHN
jgi:hypothetical protein